jgi:hypothetical protein
MNDKLLTFVLIIFFSSIIINGLLLMVSATPSGAWITSNNFISNDLQYGKLNEKSISTPDGFISNTSQSQDASSFNPFTLDGVLAGVFSINLLISGLFLLEKIFWQLSLAFPIFSPILLSVASIFIASKLLLVGYAGSALINAILGRR